MMLQQLLPALFVPLPPRLLKSLRQVWLSRPFVTVLYISKYSFVKVDNNPEENTEPQPPGETELEIPKFAGKKRTLEIEGEDFLPLKVCYGLLLF